MNSTLSPATDRRHPTLDRIERHLSVISASIAAPASATVPGGLLLLPSVLWKAGPATHAKAHRGKLPFPVRWAVPRAQIIPTGTRVTLEWTSEAWGVKDTGAVTVVCDRVAPPCLAVRDLTDVDALPEALVLGSDEPEYLLRQLVSLAERAEEARWALHLELATWLQGAVNAAHRAVSAEMKVRRCLDRTALDDLTTELELGAGGDGGLIARTIDRLADPTRVRPAVDSVRHIVVSFRRDAELALRRRLDDPRWVGAALRSFAKDRPQLGLDELVAEFNASGRLRERVGIGRAIKALSPAVQPETVELVPERWRQRAETNVDAETLELALRTAYAEFGGVAEVARLSIPRGPDEPPCISALRHLVGSRRELRRLSQMTEEEATRFIAGQLLDAGAA